MEKPLIISGLEQYPDLLQNLEKVRLNLSHFFLLELLYFDQSIEDYRFLLPNLERKEFVANDKLTELGRNTYKLLLTTKVEKVPKADNSEIDQQFEEWWLIYPSSDKFEYNGKSFKGMQKKSIKKAECKVKFRELVKTGGYTSQQVIEGTKQHLIQVKEVSVQKGINQMSFVPNSERYLREECFSPYIGETKKETQEYTGICI